MRQFTQQGRITSIHGILLPPKKKQIVRKYITLRFVITGTIPSKKNMIWAATNLFSILKRLYSFKSVKECIDWLRINLKSFIRNSQKYIDWMEVVKPVLIEQAAKEAKKYLKYDIIYPLDNVSVKVYHYWQDNMERDNSNKYDSIIDLFVSCGILANDAWQIVGKNESESECYSGQILKHITTIDVTVRIL
ncbi:MAG: hypothetical protein ABI091_14755 [Ferruginibacter sp.]